MSKTKNQPVTPIELEVDKPALPHVFIIPCLAHALSKDDDCLEQVEYLSLPEHAKILRAKDEDHAKILAEGRAKGRAEVWMKMAEAYKDSPPIRDEYLRKAEREDTNGKV